MLDPFLSPRLCNRCQQSDIFISKQVDAAYFIGNEMTLLDKILILCFLIYSAVGDNIGHQVILSDAAKSYGAMCLDGSPGNYYFANGTESKKYVIFFQGGGWCSGLYKANSKRVCKGSSSRTKMRFLLI